MPRYVAFWCDVRASLKLGRWFLNLLIAARSPEACTFWACLLDVLHSYGRARETFREGPARRPAPNLIACSNCPRELVPQIVPECFSYSLVY